VVRSGHTTTPVTGRHPASEDRQARWRVGPLPSVKQLQQEQDVGRDTVLRAIHILRSEGLVFTVPRRGTYVSPNAK
jgi:DNA-binding GntR family transcriptional regulator